MKENELSSRKKCQYLACLAIPSQMGDCTISSLLKLHILLSLTFGFINSTTSPFPPPFPQDKNSIFFFPEAAFLCILMGRQGLQKVTPYRKRVAS